MNSGDRKILFVVSSYQQYQTYIQTQVLKEIQDRVFFIVTPRLAHMDFGVFKDRVFSYTYPAWKERFHRHVFYINGWMNKKKIPAFWGRLVILRPGQKRIYSILSLPIINRIVKFLFLERAKDAQLLELVRNINPSMMLLPSHAFDGLSVELIRSGKKLGIPSMMVIDNWDTLCTKTTFTFKPDYLGVWSQQQVEHAVTMRGMPQDRIHILGAPRFMRYVAPEARQQPSPYPFKYVLYVGMSDPFNELGALKMIDDIIERQKLGIKIVYRPNITQHTRNCPDVFFEYDYRHVVLDEPARKYYKKSASWDISQDSFNPIYFPDPAYYVNLLSNMEFMVLSHSTMILEAALFDKKMYLLSYDDKVHPFGPHWLFNFEGGLHLKHIDRLSLVRMVPTIEDVEKIFAPGDPLKKDVEPLALDYFIDTRATAQYSRNLKAVIDGILGVTH